MRKNKRADEPRSIATRRIDMKISRTDSRFNPDAGIDGRQSFALRPCGQQPPGRLRRIRLCAKKMLRSFVHSMRPGYLLCLAPLGYVHRALCSNAVADRRVALKEKYAGVGSVSRVGIGILISKTNGNSHCGFLCSP